MHVHRAAGLARHRLGHEGGVDAVLEGGLAQGALEQEGLVGELERVAVVEVDLHLRRPGLVGQRVDVDLLRLAPVVDILEDRVELVDRVDAERLARRLLPARAADRRHQRVVRVLVDLGQEEFELGCHHRLPALVCVELEHPAQHVARGDLDRRAVMVEAVGDAPGRWARGTRAPAGSSSGRAAGGCRGRPGRSRPPRDTRR